MRFVRHGASIALSLLAAGCTTPGPSSPEATLEQQQAHCRNLMYENRRIVGRGPPNWNMYDYCMREARRRRRRARHRAVRNGADTDAADLPARWGTLRSAPSSTAVSHARLAHSCITSARPVHAALTRSCRGVQPVVISDAAFTRSPPSP
jgi:hypothetical protein